MNLLTVALVVVQWLHILAGITWFGAYIFLDFVIWPALLRRPALEAKAANEVIGKVASPLMIVAANLVVLLGIVRGTLLGPIRSFAFLLGTAYGLTWLGALLLAIALMVWGANWHERWLGPVWEDDHVRPGAVARLRVGTAIEMCAFGAILACMVLMGIGL